MKRETAGERARRALRGHWSQALAWEGAVLCGVLALAAAQGIAAAAWKIPMAIPTPAFVRAHPALLYIAAGGALVDLLCLSPIRFGRTAFYVKRASARLSFVPVDPEPEQQKPSLLRSRRGQAAIRKWLMGVRRLWQGGRYRRIIAGRLLWWGWNGLGAALLLTTPVLAFWLSATLPEAAAPYPFYLAILSWPLLVSGAGLWVMWSLRLSPLMVLLAAHPSWSVSRAARRAFRATRGRTWRLLRQTLGFFGWFFTCAAVVPAAYVSPMFATAQAGWLLSAALESETEKNLV